MSFAVNFISLCLSRVWSALESSLISTSPFLDLSPNFDLEELEIVCGRFSPGFNPETVSDLELTVTSCLWPDLSNLWFFYLLYCAPFCFAATLLDLSLVVLTLVFCWSSASKFATSYLLFGVSLPAGYLNLGAEVFWLAKEIVAFLVNYFCFCLIGIVCFYIIKM